MKKAMVTLVLLWGAIAAAVFVAIHGLRHLLGGEHHRFEGRPEGFRHEGMGPQGQGGFGHQPYMYGPHQAGEFHWLGFLLFVIIALAVVVLLVRWLRGKTKSSAMKQFVNIPLTGTQTPVNSQNASILDQWEKNMMNKKEIE